MTTYKPTKILRELRNLITYSCKQLPQKNPVVESVHVAIVKKYFAAQKVSFDYENSLINLQVPISEREFSHVTLECRDMEKFLKSCIEEDPTSLAFYQNMLIYYNVEKSVA